MNRDFRDYLLDMYNSIEEIEEFTKNMDYESFCKDKKTINATIRSLQVFGEASKKIPDEVKCKYLEIPWRYILGMRDKLTHEYFGVDIEILWTVISEEILEIKDNFLKVLIKEKNRYIIRRCIKG